jgi:hypothetical protein
MAFTNSIPATHFVAVHKVTTPAEQKLKLEQRAEWLKKMIANSEHDTLAKRNFEQDLVELRELYKNILTDDVIQQRCENLSKLCKEHNIRIIDNRSAYRSQTDRAVAALCGGAV